MINLGQFNTMGGYVIDSRETWLECIKEHDQYIESELRKLLSVGLPIHGLSVTTNITQKPEDDFVRLSTTIKYKGAIITPELLASFQK